MSKLEYSLFILNNQIIFTIFEQDARFIANDEWENGLEFKASNGWYVKSQNEPEIDCDSKEIFLRGANDNKNNKVLLITIDTDVKDYLEEICYEINKALKEWSKDWEGWNDPNALSFSKISFDVIKI